MDGAWIAVVGTLGGVVVTASSALLGSTLTARYLQAAVDRQAAVAATERLRTEKRAAFVDYLVAYTDLRERILSLARRGRGSASTGRAHLDDFAPDEAARFSRAYHTLRITANDKTGWVAHECTAQLWDLADVAVTGSADDFVAAKAAGKPLRRELRVAMREELGISG